MNPQNATHKTLKKKYLERKKKTNKMNNHKKNGVLRASFFFFLLLFFKKLAKGKRGEKGCGFESPHTLKIVENAPKVRT